MIIAPLFVVNKNCASSVVDDVNSNNNSRDLMVFIRLLGGQFALLSIKPFPRRVPEREITPEFSRACFPVVRQKGSPLDSDLANRVFDEWRASALPACAVRLPDRQR